MVIEKHVCDLEYAKRLDELGVKQESLFYHHYDIKEWRLDYWTCGLIEHHENYSAFTASELGEMLPLWWDSGKREEKDYICRVFKKNLTDCKSSFGETEANARAKMLIYLIENGYMKNE